MDYSPPGSSIHGTLQARVPEWVAISFSRDLPGPGNKCRSPALQAHTLLREPPGKSEVWGLLSGDFTEVSNMTKFNFITIQNRPRSWIQASKKQKPPRWVETEIRNSARNQKTGWVTDAYATILISCTTSVSAFSSTDCVTSNTALNAVHLLTLTGLNETLNYIIKTLHLMDH